MYNFRAVLNIAPDKSEDVLDLTRAGPLPDWQPPRH
jgi:hypothetical protein